MTATVTDFHTSCVNRLHGLYVPHACQNSSPQELGYDGFVDPCLGDHTLDHISLGDEGDVQYFRIVGTSLPDKAETLKEEIQEFLSLDITLENVEAYLSSKGVALTPLSCEHVTVVPQSVYRSWTEEIQQVIDDFGAILWIVDVGTQTEVWKEFGSHQSMELERLIDRESNGKVEIRDVNSDFCPVVRNSRKEVLLFRFAERLITYSYNRQKESISLHRLDEIMVESEQGEEKILGHLPPEEREEIWNDCMWHMKHDFDLMKVSTSSLHQFEWKSPRFLRYKGDRSKKLDKVRQELGLGVDA